MSNPAGGSLSDYVGSLPSDWRLVPLKALFSRRVQRGESDRPLLSVYRDLGVVLREGREDNRNRPSDDLASYLHVDPGDLAVNKMKAWAGSVAVSDLKGVVSPAYLVCSPTHKEDSRFLHHFLRSSLIRAFLNSRSFGVRPDQWDLRWDDLRETPVALPPKEEQRAIVRFLDAETARIDALIRTRELLIERLQEERHRYLVATVSGEWEPGPRKHLEIPWLRDVPTGWRVWKIGHAFSTVGSGTTPPADEVSFYDGDIPWVTTSELRETVINETNKRVSARALEMYPSLKLYPVGSLVIAMYGATIGRLGFLGIRACTNQACCVLHGSTILDARFVYYWLLAFRKEIIRRGEGAGQPNIGQDTIRNLRIPAPDVEKQRALVETLDSIFARSEELKKRVRDAVALLMEHRVALITAAVTGQIDVRSAA